MEEINAVARELQCWYQRHSIRWYLARQTRQRLAATTIQCWKQHIWLDCWFAQQALQHQKCLRLQLLCRSASAYAVSVWGDRRPPPTLTNKTSDPKASVIPSGIVVCCYHEGGRLDKPIVLVVAQVEGIGLVLQILEILEGGRCVCPWFSGLHKLPQHWTYSVFSRIILI
jgi:hypothetical protein